MALAGLPFAEFLAVLQARGIPIGIPEHQDLGKLLVRFEHARRDELRDSIAALLARNHEDLQQIRALFDDLYPAVDPPSPPALPDPYVRRKTWRQLGIAALCCVVLALILGAAWWWRKPPRVVEPPPLASPTAEAPLRREGARPPLPEGKAKTSLRPLAGWLALGFGGLFVALWLQRMRFARNQKTRTLRDDAWQALSGPDVFRPQPPQPPLSIARDDLEEFATLLSLLCAEYDQGSAIDIDRSVDLLARTGYLLQPAQLRSLLRQPIVVLQDRSFPTALFAYKADALVRGLQRSGVPIYRYFFSGRADRVTPDVRSGSREALRLTDLLRLHPGAPLFVISLGTTISDADVPWLDTLATVTRRAWLLPLCAPLPTSQRLRALFPQRIFALHRGGLRGVAYALAQDQDRRPGRRIVAHGARHATQQETTRLLRRLAFLPLFDLSLADWLRQRCCPDVPESALLSLLAHCEGVPGSTLRLSPPQRDRLQRDLQTEEPDELVLLRRALIEIFQSSEPAAGSLAHLRWQLALSTQRLHSTDIATATAHDRDQLSHHVRTLQESPLAPEIQAVLRQAAPQLQPALQPLAVPSSGADSAVWGPLRLAVPGVREVLLASLGTALLAGLLLLLGQGRIQPPEPVECLKIEVAYAAPDPVFRRPLSPVAMVTADCGNDGPPTQVKFFVAQASEAKFHELRTQKTASAQTEYWAAELPSDARAYYALGQGKNGKTLYSPIITAPQAERDKKKADEGTKISLEIQSEPSAAEVTINGKPSGKTPLSTSINIASLPTRAGDEARLRVEVSLNGFESYYEDLTDLATRTSPIRIFARLRQPVPAAAPDEESSVAVPVAPAGSPPPPKQEPATEKPLGKGSLRGNTEARFQAAQELYKKGQFKKAIDAAEALKRYDTERAFRIIGASACMLKDLSLAQTALRNTIKSAKQYIIYVCQRNGVDIFSTGEPEKTKGQSGSIDTTRGEASQPATAKDDFESTPDSADGHAAGDPKPKRKKASTK